MPFEPPAYCFNREFSPMARTERVFDRDYLLYAMSGAIRLGVADRTWLLPPAFAAWVPAGTSIAFEMTHPVTSCSVLYERGFCAEVAPALPDRVVVFAMNALAREMALYARRWGPDGHEFDDPARIFFLAFAGVVAERAQLPANVWRPATNDPALMRAVAFTEAEYAGSLNISRVAAAAGLSSRTLLRRYAAELGVTWAQSLRRTRVIAAMEKLIGTEEQVTAIAFDVGYRSLSAFNSAFRELAGTTPTEFRAAGSPPGQDLAQDNIQ